MTVRNESRTAAIESGAKRYIGLFCSKHSEMKGECMASNRCCLACNKEKMRVARASNPEYHRLSTRAAYEKWYPKNKEKVKAYHRELKTGISPEMFKALWDAQGGC